jgi:hypothetical protein
MIVIVFTSKLTNYKIRRKNFVDNNQVHAPARNKNSADISELELSAYVTIEPHSEPYVCIHNILAFMSQKSGCNVKMLKWKHFHDKKFLVTFQDKL